MKKTIFNVVFVILILSISGIFSLEFEFDVKHEWIFNQSIINGEDGNPLKYSFFNLFDNNSNTTLAVNTNVRKTKEGTPYFNIFFKQNYPITKMVIFNGFQRNRDLFYKNARVKGFELWVNKVITDNKGNKEYLKVLKTNYTLEDVIDKQVIEFPFEISGLMWSFNILSTYPGTQYDDICISEIEFWYKGEKYEVKNLEEAKREYIKMRRDEAIWDAGMLNVACDGEILEDVEVVKNRFKELGIDVSKIYLQGYTNEASDGSKSMVTGFTMQFSYNSKTNGKILFARNVDLNDMIRKRGKSVHSWYEIVDPVKVGEWRIDEYGNIWIKIGKGKWKRSRNWFGFDGTDLGPCRYLSPIG